MICHTCNSFIYTVPIWEGNKGKIDLSLFLCCFHMCNGDIYVHKANIVLQRVKKIKAVRDVISGSRSQGKQKAEPGSEFRLVTPIKVKLFSENLNLETDLIQNIFTH